MGNNNKLNPGEIYAVAVATLPATDIDHHNSDLYIKRTPAAMVIINRLENKSLLSVFRDPNGDPCGMNFHFALRHFGKILLNIIKGGDPMIILWILFLPFAILAELLKISK